MALHWKFTAEKILLVKIPKRARTTTETSTDEHRDEHRSSVGVSDALRAFSVLVGCSRAFEPVVGSPCVSRACFWLARRERARTTTERQARSSIDVSVRWLVRWFESGWLVSKPVGWFRIWLVGFEPGWLGRVRTQG